MECGRFQYSSGWPAHIYRTFPTDCMPRNNDLVNGFKASGQMTWLAIMSCSWPILGLSETYSQPVLGLVQDFIFMMTASSMCQDYLGHHQTISEQAVQRTGATHEQSCTHYSASFHLQTSCIGGFTHPISLDPDREVIINTMSSKQRGHTPVKKTNKTQSPQSGNHWGIYLENLWVVAENHGQWRIFSLSTDHPLTVTRISTDLVILSMSGPLIVLR